MLNVIPVTLATRAPHANGCKTRGIDIPMPVENKKAPAINNPVIEARRKFPADSHMPK